VIENKNIKEISTSEVISVHENQNLSDVTAIFRENSIHHVPVLRGSKPVGILSSQDIFKLIFNVDSTDQRMLDVLLDNTYKLSEVMTTELVILDESATVKDMARLLSDSSLHSVLVVDHKGDLCGIATTTDLVRYLHDNIGD
jgi:predicted transcriptional regulator